MVIAITSITIVATATLVAIRLLKAQHPGRVIYTFNFTEQIPSGWDRAQKLQPAWCKAESDGTVAAWTTPTLVWIHDGVMVIERTDGVNVTRRYLTTSKRDHVLQVIVEP